MYKVAEEDTFDYDYNYYYENIVSNFFIIFFLSFFVIPIIAIIINIKKEIFGNYGYIDNKTINKKNTPMFREIPCDKDIYYANALIKLNNFNYVGSNIFGAIILKWVRGNKIIFINEKKGVFSKETTKLDLRSNPTFDNESESKLFDMMYKASKDGILESKELEKWCKKNYSKFLKLFERIENSKIDELKETGHIYKRKNKYECKRRNVMDDKIYDDSSKLFGLKLFLEEFSNIETKEVLDVHLWDEYLMFAYLFGIADKVAKQLKNMYPEIIEQMDFDYNTIIFINYMSTRSVSAANSARSAAQSYSSGGGGFSSGGGGGSAGGR